MKNAEIVSRCSHMCVGAQQFANEVLPMQLKIFQALPITDLIVCIKMQQVMKILIISSALRLECLNARQLYASTIGDLSHVKNKPDENFLL